MVNSVHSAVGIPKFISEPDPDVYKRGKYVVLDFETCGPKGKGQALYPENRIVLAVWRDVHGKEHALRAGEFDLQPLLADLAEADFLVAHNAKFELQWLARCGLPLGNVLVWDTMLAEYVIGGNRWTYGKLSLNEISRRRFGEGKLSLVSKLIKRGVPVDEIPASWLEKYCRRDVELTERLFKVQLAEICSEYPRLLPIVYTRCIVCPVIADVELNGLALDGNVVRTSLQEKEVEFAGLSGQLQELMPGVNVDSPLQVGNFIYDTLGFEERSRKKNGKWEADRTEAGGRRTDADTIEALRTTTEGQRRFKELFARTREVGSELSKYLRKFGDCCDTAGGILYASFNQANTSTHRFSSSGLDFKTQLQNLPREFKRFFRARREGWLIGDGDGAQLEFRVAVHLGRDAVGLQSIISGEDVHAVTAGITGHTRQDAKRHTFKPLYGGRSGTASEVEYYEFFRDKYEDIARTQGRWIDEVLANKSLVTEWGLRFFWPSTRMERSGYITNREAICNYPVQSFATAEIIPIALVYFWYVCRAGGLQLVVVNTVHDSIAAEFPPEEEPAFREVLRDAMTNKVYWYLERMYGVKLVVPLACGIKVGEHWGEGKEEKYEADQLLWRPNNPLAKGLE